MAVLEARDVGFHGRGTNLVIISITFLSVALCLVGARVTSRVTTGRKIGLDDYAIITSVVRSRSLHEVIDSYFDAYRNPDLANWLPQTFSIALTICNCICELTSHHFLPLAASRS